MQLLTQTKSMHHCSNQTLLWCLKLFMQSSSAHKQMYDYNLINMPHFQNMKKINQRSMNNFRANSLKYFQINMLYLKEHEKLVLLQMKEIHINPMFYL